MADWQPQDGTHGYMAGAPDQYCYKCSAYCGGLDAAGNQLVCPHCAALGLPPSAADPGPSVVPQTGGTGADGNPYALTTTPTGDGINPEHPPAGAVAEDAPL